MEGRQLRQLHPPAVQEGGSRHEKRVGPFFPERRKHLVDFTRVAGVVHLHLQADGAGRSSHLTQGILRVAHVGRVHQHGQAGGARHQLAQEFKPLRLQLVGVQIDAGEIAAGPGEAADKAEPGRVFADQKNDRYRRGRRLGRERGGRAARCDNHSGLSPDQLGRHLRQAIDPVLGPTVQDRHVLAFGKIHFFQALAKSREAAPIASGDLLSRNATSGSAGCCP